MASSRFTFGLSALSAMSAIALLSSSSGFARPAAAQQLQQPTNTIFESVSLSPGFSRDPLTVRGISGGNTSAADLAERTETPTGPCVGFVDDQPDHTMELSAFFDYLSLEVESTEDTTLIVRGPGGTWCNDDFNRMNPGIAGQWLSGTYQIWVGSYRDESYYPYVIRISETR